MPRAPKRCGRGGCDELMPCSVHAEKRPYRPQYGSAHQRERREWEPLVAAGQIHCRRGAKCRRRPDTLIEPGKPWHLGHPDAECPEPKAPEHAACNTSAPGRLR